MENLFNFFLSNLGLKNESDNLILDFYKQIYDYLLSSITKSIQTNTDPLIQNLARDVYLQRNRIELENIIKNLAKQIDLKIQHDSTQLGISKYEYLKNIIVENKANDYAQECLRLTDSIIVFYRNKIEILHSRLSDLEEELKKYILQMNLYSLENLDRLIEAKLYEKNLTGPIKLTQTSSKLLEFLIRSAVIEYRSEFSSKNISAEQLCGKINTMFSLNWKRATFERHCKEKQIDWKIIANSKILAPQKAK